MQLSPQTSAQKSVTRGKSTALTGKTQKIGFVFKYDRKHLRFVIIKEPFLPVYDLKLTETFALTMAVRQLSAADDPLASKSLTEVELELHPYNMRDAAGEFFAHVERVAELIEQEKDGAILLNSLYGVNRLARIVERRLGVNRVGRITGPLSKEERKEAPFKPLLLATPTVDIGFNFEGHPKDYQNLDFIGFEAPLEDQFWQRLGRAGRVLGKPVQDIPAFALTFIPDGAWTRLRDKVQGQNTLSRAELKKLLHEAAEGDMQRASFHEYVSSYALLEITQPLAEMERLLGTEHAVLIEQAFATIKRVYAPSSKRQLRNLKGVVA
jgi:CRISPR-associated endonuclease/helicase Cas3